jgi:hypothetical protein
MPFLHTLPLKNGKILEITVDTDAAKGYRATIHTKGQAPLGHIIADTLPEAWDNYRYHQPNRGTAPVEKEHLEAMWSAYETWDSEHGTKLNKKEIEMLNTASALLTQIANAEALAAATTTRHDGYTHLQKSERISKIARNLQNLKHKYQKQRQST